MRNNIARSIAAYEDSTEVNQFSSKFDAFLVGEAELTAQEAEGQALVEEKCGCHSFSNGLFTNFRFFNLGLPKNPDNPVYDDAPTFIDTGLEGFLETRGEDEETVEANIGKFKTPTLRNVDKCPGQGFIKAYMHNGVFKSLKEVVHFYNTRNARILDETLAPEVSDNIVGDISVDQEGILGNLGLTDVQEDAIVAFLKTLSDQGSVLPPQASSAGKK